MNQQPTRIVISLTSYPPRIRTVHLVIESLLAQTVKPWKIVLWLAEEEFPEREQSLPSELVSLTNDVVFEIDWCENIRSYKKLIPALKKYPDCAIATCDDDIYYPPDMLERVLQAHIASPDYILSMWVRIVTARNGVVQSFLDWLPTWIGGQNQATASTDNYLLGGSPTLYPPHSFNKLVFDMELAKELCPHQDDLWFWAMAVLNRRMIRGVSCRGYAPQMLPGTQSQALWSNNQRGGNDMAIKRLFARFPELKNRLMLSHRPLPKEARHFGGLLCSKREGSRVFSVRLNIPFFQMKYSEDFSTLTYYILKIPVYCKRLTCR